MTTRGHRDLIFEYSRILQEEQYDDRGVDMWEEPKTNECPDCIHGADKAPDPDCGTCQGHGEIFEGADELHRHEVERAGLVGELLGHLKYNHADDRGIMEKISKIEAHDKQSPNPLRANESYGNRRASQKAWSKVTMPAHKARNPWESDYGGSPITTQRQAEKEAADDLGMSDEDVNKEMFANIKKMMGEEEEFQPMGAAPPDIPIDNTEEEIFVQQMKNSEKARMLYFKQLEQKVGQTSQKAPHLSSMAVKGSTAG